MDDVLPTNVRLKIMKIRNSESCDFCDEQEFTMHIFYFCRKIKLFLSWFRLKLSSVCSISNRNWMNILFFDFDYNTNRDRNAAVILICNYLYVVWIGRSKNLDENEMISYFKGKLSYCKGMLKLVYGEKLKKLVTKDFLEMVI